MFEQVKFATEKHVFVPVTCLHLKMWTH